MTNQAMGMHGWSQANLAVIHSVKFVQTRWQQPSEWDLKPDMFQEYDLVPVGEAEEEVTNRDCSRGKGDLLRAVPGSPSEEQGTRADQY